MSTASTSWAATRDRNVMGTGLTVASAAACTAAAIGTDWE